DSEFRANLANAVGSQVADAADSAVLFNELSDVGVHHEPKLRKLRGFGSDEAEKARLRDHQNVRKTGLQAAKIERAKLAVGELQRRPGDLLMSDFVEFRGQANLIDDFHDRWMNSVAAELTIEVLVHFKESDLDAAAGQEQSQDSPGRP